MPTPRPAAVLLGDGRVVAEDGSDATDAYRRGANAAVALARAVGARRAVLKARSPSCGCSGVYAPPPAPTGEVVPGMGVTAAALAAAGLELSSEEDEAPAVG